MTGVTAISMPRGEARAAFLEYRRAFREASTKEQQQIDRALMNGYRAIAAGKTVIDLHEAMRAAGRNDAGYPKLAICRAHEQRCTVSIATDGDTRFYGGVATWRPRRSAVIRLPGGTLPPDRRLLANAVAIVPLIPPQFRPPFKLENYHVLWEAEWRPVPPTDPMLLKHLEGGLYAVLAQWDLSPLERAVLGQRLATR